MTREDIIRMAQDIGWIVKPCYDPTMIAVQCGIAPDANERMRVTAEGAVLIVDDGYYWQIGTTQEVAAAIRARGQG